MSTSGDRKIGSLKDYKWGGSVDELRSVLEHVLSKPGVKEKPATELAAICTLELCDVIGGAIIYFPRAARIRVKMRNESIFRASQNGEKVQDLARSYRLAVQTIYDIIARERGKLEEKN